MTPDGGGPGDSGPNHLLIISLWIDPRLEQEMEGRNIKFNRLHDELDIEQDSDDVGNRDSETRDQDSRGSAGGISNRFQRLLCMASVPV